MCGAVLPGIIRFTTQHPRDHFHPPPTEIYVMLLRKAHGALVTTQWKNLADEIHAALPSEAKQSQVTIEWDETDKFYVATSVMRPFCRGHGDTIEAATEMALDNLNESLKMEAEEGPASDAGATLSHPQCRRRELPPPVQAKIDLVRGWFEGHPDSAIIEELATQWVKAEESANMATKYDHLLGTVRALSIKTERHKTHISAQNARIRTLKNDLRATQAAFALKEQEIERLKAELETRPRMLPAIVRPNFKPEEE